MKHKANVGKIRACYGAKECFGARNQSGMVKNGDKVQEIGYFNIQCKNSSIKPRKNV